jgi:CubicO group peptidase (beta-lactamase class C family)
MIAGGFLGTSRHRSRQLDRLLQPWINAWTFSHMRWLRPVEPVRAAVRPVPLPRRDRVLDVRYRFDGSELRLSDLHRRTETTAFVVLHRGAVVHEAYPGRFAGAARPFLLFSLTKSMLSVLVGIAVAEGAIKDVDEPVVTYLPHLRGTAYDGPSVMDLMNMSSGAGDLEDWADPGSLIIRFKKAIDGDGGLQELVASVEPRTPPGTAFNYSSVDAQVIGWVLEQATKTALPEFAADRLWARLGAERDGYFWLSRTRPRTAIGAGSFNATPIDVARLGLMMARNGAVDGEQIVPSDWVARCRDGALPHLSVGALGPSGYPHYGYSCLWWTLDGPRRPFTGLGIYGQYLYVDPEVDVVAVKLSAWPTPDDPDRDRETINALRAVADYLATDTSTSPGTGHGH